MSDDQAFGMLQRGGCDTESYHFYRTRSLTPKLDTNLRVFAPSTSCLRPTVYRTGYHQCSNCFEESPSTTTKSSIQWDGAVLGPPSISELKNRETAQSTSSRQWKALQTEILLRDKRTGSSMSRRVATFRAPHPQGHRMSIDHIDGDASNNNPYNLRILCPPCSRIRHWLRWRTGMDDT